MGQCQSMLILTVLSLL